MREAVGGGVAATVDASRQLIAQKLHANSDLEMVLDVSRSLVFKIKPLPDYGGDLMVQ
jgi:hypothetical protein